MRDQRLSGKAPHGDSGGLGAPTGDAKGSRTPGAGAAHERRVPINIETPPLSMGPIYPAGLSDLEGMCVCGYPLGAHLSPHPHELDLLSCPNFRPAPLFFGTPISYPPLPLGSHPPAPGPYASHNRASGRLPDRKAAGLGAGTLRLFRRVLLSIVTPVAFFLFFWAVLFGYLAIFVLSRVRR